MIKKILGTFLNDIKAVFKTFNSPEWIFLILFIVAGVRLCQMQLRPHEDYEAMYNKIEIPENLDLGEIQDRNGNPIAARAKEIDLKIKTFKQLNKEDISKEVFKMPKLEDNREYKECEENPKAVFRKTWALFKPWTWFRKEFSYMPPCLAYKNDKIKKNLIFQDRFKNEVKKNMPRFEKDCKFKIESTVCENISFVDYIKYRNILKESVDVKSIDGFTFSFENNGIMDSICRYASLPFGDDYSDEDKKQMDEIVGQSKEIKVGELAVVKALSKGKRGEKSEEKSKREAELAKIINGIKSAGGSGLDSDVTISTYCAKNMNEDAFVLSVNRNRMFNRLRFTMAELNQIFSQEEIAQMDDSKILKKDYCKANYSDKICIAIYKQKLEKIEDFFLGAKDYYNGGSFCSQSKEAICLGLKDKIAFLKNNPPSTGNLYPDDYKLGTMSYSSFHELFPAVNITNGYNTYGIEFEEKDSFINMFGDIGIPSDVAKLGYDKIAESDKIMKKFFSRDYIFREKPANADYIFAPYLGLNLGGMNIIDVLKSDNVFYADSDGEEKASSQGKVKHEYCKDKENGDLARFYIYRTDKKSLKYYHGKCKVTSTRYAFVPEKDKNGNEIREWETWRGIVPKYMPDLKQGKNIQLTIDRDLQAYTAHSLAKRCEELKADRGFAVIQNVNNGEILAMAEYSSPYSKILYKDKDEYKDYKQWQPGSPAGISYRTYKPGSTFKPFAVAFALEEEKIKEIIEKKSIPLREKFNKYRDSKDPDIAKAWNEIHEHGNKNQKPPEKITLERIIAQSSNIGTAYIAYEMWQKIDQKRYPAKPSDWENDFALINRAKEFGFSLKTGFEEETSVLESSGHIRPIEPQNISDSEFDPNKPGGKKLILQEYLKTSYGQGPLEVTPLQLIAAYSALVNGGTLHAPHIVKSIGGKEQKYESKKGIISEKTSGIIRRYMKAVMECGTGKDYKPKEFNMGGKTGTADISLGRGKKPNANLASFIGFIPYEKPEYAILVMIDENAKMGKKNSDKYRLQGAAASGPVLQELAEKLYEKILRKQ